MPFSRMLRVGDYVEAKQGNGEVPIGTVGKVTKIRETPEYGVQVEWGLRKYPYTKTAWHGRKQVEPIGSSR
jgi:hypothetical protein